MEKNKNIIITIGAVLAFVLCINFYSYLSFSRLTVFDTSAYVNKDDAKFSVDSFKNNTNSVYVTGWLFVDGRDNTLFKNKLLVLNVNSGKYYEGNIKCNKRPDVSKVFSGQGDPHNYDNSGFTGAIEKNRSKLSGINKIFIAYDDGEVKRLVDLNTDFEIK